MATTYPIHHSATVAPTEAEVVHGIHTMLRVAYGLVPIIAGLDKFTNLLVDWTQYLSPAIPSLVHLTPHAFMLIVGVIEIIAGILVFAWPKVGATIVTLWLWAIAAQLVFQGRYFDIAVRDVAMSLGAITLARLDRFVHPRATTT
jgi:uncharacterized membrane protein HdeD (DUF308 family)